MKYILPKLRNWWGEEELVKQAQRRPTRFYRDIHGRGVRGEIAEAELAEARATMSSFGRKIVVRELMTGTDAYPLDRHSRRRSLGPTRAAAAMKK